MGQEWLTVKQVALLRKCSERYILSLIKNGTLKARREGKRWMVFVDASEQNPEQQAEQIPNNSEQIAFLQQQLKERDKLIENLQLQMAEHSERTDAIIMQLTRQAGETQKALEAHKRSWWLRLWKRGRD